MNEEANDISSSGSQTDSWVALKAFTAARIALGRAGTAVPAKESLAFKLAHAHARDAVHSSLQTAPLINDLNAFGLPLFLLHSQAAERLQYLQRPDLGRRLDQASADTLIQAGCQPADVAIILADGLSATAINRLAVNLLKYLIPLLQSAPVSLAPLCLVQQGRVAVGDEIGALLSAKLTVMLIGERPGLSASDSIGAYVTYAPAIGITDEKRNCISNIRPDGLPLDVAAQKIFYLCTEALQLQLTGIHLKDHSALVDVPTRSHPNKELD